MKNVPIAFQKRNQNVSVSFPNMSFENRLFRFGPESALLVHQIDMMGTNSDVLVSFLLDVGRLGTFV
jgi:hypothetical protein